MAELVVVGFDNPTDADRVLTELTRMQKEYLIDLEDAVVAIRSEDGAVRIKQSVNMLSLGAATGGLRGALWGQPDRAAVPQPARRLCHRRGRRRRLGRPVGEHDRLRH